MGFANLNAKAKRRPTGSVTARTYTIPAPIKGINRQNSLTDMEVSEALQLENIIPGNGSVKTREGFTTIIGVPGAATQDSDSWGLDFPTTYVLVLDENRVVLGNDDYREVHLKPHTSAGGGTLPVSTYGFYPGTSGDTGFSAAGCYPIRFNNSAGSFVVSTNLSVNGFLLRWSQDGDADLVAFTASSGIASDKAQGLAVFAGRLWIFNADTIVYPDDPTLNIAYFAVGQMGGAATTFPLSGQVAKGGVVIYACNWTRDGGDGIDDYFCIFTSQGEMVVYQGTDPSNVNEWSKVGVYDIGEPITTDYLAFRKCVMKVGGDIGVLTKRGVAMISQLVNTNVSGHEKISVTHKVSKLYMDAINDVSFKSDVRTWGLCEMPEQNCVLVNVPSQNGAKQLILNVDTGAWAKWSGLEAYQWFTAGGSLYFLRPDGWICKYGGVFDGTSGTSITWKIQTAYTMMKTPQNKTVKAVRPHITAPAGYMPQIEVKVDFDMTDMNTGSGSYTDLGKSSITSLSAAVQNASWTTVCAEGYSVSVIMRGTIRNQPPIEFHAIDLMYEQGGFL